MFIRLLPAAVFVAVFWMVALTILATRNTPGWSVDGPLKCRDRTYTDCALLR